MSDEIIKILDDLGHRFGIAIDWSSKNVVPYFKNLMNRIVEYEMITSILFITLAMIAFVICVIFAVKMYKSDSISIRELFPLPIIVATIIAIFMITEAQDIVTVNVIPEKIFYEYLSDPTS